MKDKVGIVILNYNDSVTTIKLVDEIIRYDSISKILIVDNCSSDDSYSRFNTVYNNECKVDIIQSEKNGGYGAGNNIGIAYLVTRYKLRYILICNPDVHFENQTVLSLLDGIMKLEKAAIVAPVMYDRDNALEPQCAWRIPTVLEYATFSLDFISHFSKSFFYDEMQFQQTEPWEVGCVAGSMFMIDTDKIIPSNVFDENVFLYCEETILGIKVKKMDLKIYIIPGARFQHLHSVSINKSIPKEIERNKLMWRSRLYVINTYMKPQRIEKALVKICMNLSLFERRVKQIIRKLR